MKRLTLIDKAFFLKKTPLFSSLDLDLLLTIADKLNLIVFDEKEDIFVLNEDANRMYFIVKGEIEIISKNLSSCFLKSGDFFGEESLFNNKSRCYSAKAKMKTHLMTLSRTNLYTIISECPSVAIGFLQVYASTMDFRHMHK